MGYLGERFPELTEKDVDELRKLGQRFCAPPKPMVEAESSAA
jgi:hypothetical protein